MNLSYVWFTGYWLNLMLLLAADTLLGATLCAILMIAALVGFAKGEEE